MKLVGPTKSPHHFGMRNGDWHLVVNDVTEICKIFNYHGEQVPIDPSLQLKHVTKDGHLPALPRGQGDDWRFRNCDTPPGIYYLGQMYNDWADSGRNPNAGWTKARQSFGWLSFDMVELENQEAKYGRGGVMLHGGGSACGWPGAWAPYQQLFPTHGCIRMHNIHLLKVILPLYQKGKVFVSVYQDAAGY